MADPWTSGLFVPGQEAHQITAMLALSDPVTPFREIPGLNVGEFLTPTQHSMFLALFGSETGISWIYLSLHSANRENFLRKQSSFKASFPSGRLSSWGKSRRSPWPTQSSVPFTEDDSALPFGWLKAWSSDVLHFFSNAIQQKCLHMHHMAFNATWS